ncbi:HAMP domain-containing sensor histidine kinase [Pseudodesulfovibrio sp. zrk46]|uniref:HAMP domain-containing sensor histidine kinase n=1 Tax=Pseudodesulfovibrio sp. zrk46 TaxID=2725288 RepID=UPI001448FCB5|nr:HAMP domain-containing sensor histidine kinase [Pseudodesulfovibrio sp. zrk46]QJB55627.1 HAMP domain-containing histidine kinase [Pseudodesulfovibrio sp. zrk46]
MKVSSLYFRMLAIFVVVQIAATLIMGFLVHSGKIRPPFTRHAEERTRAIKRLLIHELEMEKDFPSEFSAHESRAARPPKERPRPDRAPVHRQMPPPNFDLKGRLAHTLSTFASAFEGQVWLTNDSGRVVASSFGGPPPTISPDEVELEHRTPEGYTLRLMKRDGDETNIYMSDVFQNDGETLTLHLLHKWKKRREEEWFMKGLILMSTISALLLIPAYRMLTRPLRQLTDSAELLARGDFSPRVQARWKGEISVLARAFNRMAESLEKMIRGSKELTANVSHELRSPLARIRISQQILMERLEDGRTDGMEKHLSKMEAEIEHMDGLIDQILKLSKMDLQEAPAQDDKVNLNAMLEEAAERLYAMASKRSVTLTLNTEDLPTLRCHRDTLRMVLDNVTTNAVKYTEEGSTITVSSRREENEAVIEVANPYRDLCESELETIFIPFKRLGYESVEGNGLGLAFARKIVEEHGGTMEAQSGDGMFRMIVRLPLV